MAAVYEKLWRPLEDDILLFLLASTLVTLGDPTFLKS